ncbi:hypothetical protein CBR_g3364 [Chara braunii]|uniref:Uncharacterized protein n=1 Tax=Chara braunii TaxID=69332 RepID=A0A388JQQ5_CHABU|nr:hypothetical protein CBR_g3364 [Chara braunii]|eukprot:GBG60120.1 hypothetical protein CBR_g3364 [Chara braunii]
MTTPSKYPVGAEAVAPSEIGSSPDSRWQQGGGYVLPWIMDGVNLDRDRGRPDKDEEDGDPEPEVWGARPVGTVGNREIWRQIEDFRKDDISRPREVLIIFRDRAATLPPFDHVTPPPSHAAAEGSLVVDQDGEDDWMDPEDIAGAPTRRWSKVYFTNGGGSDGHAPRTSIITDDVAGGAQGRNWSLINRWWDSWRGGGDVDDGSVPLEDDATQVEEGAGIHAGHNGMSDASRQGSSPRGARVDMSLAMIVRPPLVRDGETRWHADSGRPVSFFPSGYSGEMPRWDGGESGECTPTTLHPEQLERLGTEDPFPCTGGLASPPTWAPVSPRWTGSSHSDICERESLDSQAAVFSGGVASSQMQPPQRPLSPALYQGPALATSLPPTGGRGTGRGSSSSHRGGRFGGWSSCRRVTNRPRRDYSRGQGLFARGPSEEGVPAVGASEARRRILGLDKIGMRRTERVEAYPAQSAI